MTSNREQPAEARAAFLADAGWRDARSAPLAGDASTRRYERLTQNGARAVLMIAPLAAEAAPCPPDASPAERTALGYNAQARLAGPNLNAFIDIANILRQAGLSAPEIYAADAENGFALIEDLGDDLFAHAITQGVSEAPLYEAAIDALAALGHAAPPPPASSVYTMLSYDLTALQVEAALLTQWYWPLKKSETITADMQADYQDRWAAVFGQISAPHIITLRDYHGENLLWLPRREGVRRVGMIDFQDALYGYAAYDLVSLLEDARRDVSPALASAMVERYCEKTGRDRPFDRASFDAGYAVLAAQRKHIRAPRSARRQAALS